MGHIFSIMDDSIEDILIIEELINCANLLKSKENARMSIRYDFSAIRIRVPPSAYRNRRGLAVFWLILFFLRGFSNGLEKVIRPITVTTTMS